MFKKLVLSFLLIPVVSCGGGSDSVSPDSEHQINGNSLSLLDPGTLDVQDNQIKGSGKIVFKSPLKGSDNNFSITLSLENEGSVSLSMNAGPDLKNGVNMMFKRQNKLFKVSLLTKDSSVDISDYFKNLDASSKPILYVDAHNSENPTHVLVWANTSDFSEKNALFNSEEHVATPGQGTGKFWGLELSNATVLSPGYTDPKFLEE